MLQELVGIVGSFPICKMKKGDGKAAISLSQRGPLSFPKHPEDSRGRKYFAIFRTLKFTKEPRILRPFLFGLAGNSA
jgi:hypothetical protein